MEKIKRKTIITGHYGSGKTEFAVSLAMLLAREEAGRLALIDLDIVNPYFRSRERRGTLARSGVAVYGSVYDFEVTVENPSLGANVRAPLEDKNCRAIIDAGGNDSGALVLNQFGKYFTDEQTAVAAVINGNRPETRDAASALEHISRIERATGLSVTGIINNTHMLRETVAADILTGHALCGEICRVSGRNLWCNCYPKGIVSPGELSGDCENLFEMGLYMRPSWLDK